MKRGLDGIAITDHNTIRGGTAALKARAEEDFEVIIGSEINTDVGEIIGLFLNEDVRSQKWMEAIEEVRDQGGLVILPHPFRGHRPSPDLLPDLVSSVDAIETFNSRTSVTLNQMAEKLARDHGKAAIAGSDAHFYSEIGLGRTSSGRDTVRKAMLSGDVSPFGCRYSAAYLQSSSQLIKAVKMKRYILIPRLMARTVLNFVTKM